MTDNIRYFDVHAHYDDERFEREFPGGADNAIRESFKLGVRGIVCSGTRYETSLKSIEFAEKYPFVYATAGIHPCDCRFIEQGKDDDELARIEKLLDNPRVAAIGEIGLDYHYQDTDRKRQGYLFDSQLETAEKKALPVIVHDRDAHGDTFDAIRRHPGVRGILHCFSGSAEMARQLVKLGFMISFGGTVTFKNSKEVKEVAAIVPDDMMLLETDSPYLAPTPHRGEINFSGYLPLITKAMAEIRGESEEYVAEKTFENAERLFRIKAISE